MLGPDTDKANWFENDQQILSLGRMQIGQARLQLEESRARAIERVIRDAEVLEIRGRKLRLASEDDLRQNPSYLSFLAPFLVLDNIL